MTRSAEDEGRGSLVTRAAVTLALLVALGGAARAEPPAREERPNHGRALVEMLAVMAAGTGWYWTNTNLNAEDWELQWDWESWRKKLTLEAISFDTNTFSINAVRHPIAGIVYYQVGRANGFGVGASLLIDVLTTAVWEFMIEFKESVSLNDLIVNSAAGIGLGEPLFQLGRYARRGSTPVDKVLAFLLSPFEGLHEVVAPGRVLDGEPWHRFRLYSGGAVARFGDELTRPEARLGVDLELVTLDGYARPGARSVRTRPGAWTRLAASITLGIDESHRDAPIQGARLDARTSLAGRYRQRLDANGQGAGRFVGLATGFAIEWRRLAEEPDRLATAHLLGAQLDLTRYGDSLDLRWETLWYADFAMVQAHVFGPVLPFTPQPDPPYTSSLRPYGYYFAYGATLTSRLRLEARRWRADLELHAHHFESIDGWDREEIGGPDDPHNIVDQRLLARAAIEVYPFGSGIGVRPFVEGIVRRGLWSNRERTTFELDAGVQLSSDF